MRRVLFLLVAICFAACGTIGEEYPTHEESSVVGVGDVAPDFTVELLGGESVTLSELRGEVVLLVLFSHECPDCKMLMDDMTAARDDFDDLGVRILAIERDGSAEDVETYMASHGYDFDVAVDDNRAIYNLYATMYVLRTYLIDSEGIIVHATIEYDALYVAQILSAIPQ
ncbi:MAG: TlpA family protein disulfide reductase [Alistipes sp.]|nr:TlpA family protein disulfide reductase [Alistipes sp.]